MLAGDKTLHLNLISYPAGLGSEVRLDVWCMAPPPVRSSRSPAWQAVHRNGDTMLTFAEVNPPVTNPTPTLSDLQTAQSAMDYAERDPLPHLPFEPARSTRSPSARRNWSMRSSR